MGLDFVLPPAQFSDGKTHKAARYFFMRGRIPRSIDSVLKITRSSSAVGFYCLLLVCAPAALASTEFDVPPGAEASPTSIVAGADGNLWFFENGRQSIARVSPAGQLTEFPVPAGARWIRYRDDGCGSG